MYIAIDFDGTCVTHEFPRIGKDIGAIPVLKELVEKGHKLILHTMRSGSTLTEAIEWFDAREIPLWSINSNPAQRRWTSSKKIYAHLYIDDTALGAPLILDESISSRPFIDWNQVRKLLIQSHII